MPFNPTYMGSYPLNDYFVCDKDLSCVDGRTEAVRRVRPSINPEHHFPLSRVLKNSPEVRTLANRTPMTLQNRPDFLKSGCRQHQIGVPVGIQILFQHPLDPPEG